MWMRTSPKGRFDLPGLRVLCCHQLKVTRGISLFSCDQRVFFLHDFSTCFPERIQVDKAALVAALFLIEVEIRNCLLWDAIIPSYLSYAYR